MGSPNAHTHTAHLSFEQGAAASALERAGCRALPRFGVVRARGELGMIFGGVWFLDAV